MYKPFSVKLMQVYFVLRMILIMILIGLTFALLNVDSSSSEILLGFKHGFLNSLGGSDFSYIELGTLCGGLMFPLFLNFMNFHCLKKRKKKAFTVFLVLNMLTSIKSVASLIILLIILVFSLVNIDFKEYMTDDSNAIS